MSQHDSQGPDGPARFPDPPPYPQGYQPQPPYQQPGYDQRSYDRYYQQGNQAGYPPAGHPPAGYGYGYGYAPEPRRTNVMAILGLVFAFVFSPLGIVFSAIGLGQVRRRNERGRGLAIAGLILSIVFLLISALLLVLGFVAPATTTTVDGAASDQINASASAPPSDVIVDPGTTGGAPGTGGAAPGGGQDVLAACTVIIPALLDLETDLQDVRTPAEYGQALARLEQTMSSAATGTSDARFQQDVARLDADLEKAAAAVRTRQDPSGLEQALTADGEAVGTDCRTAGATD